MTRILQLHASAGLYGGESVILALSNALRARGVEVVIGCVEMPGRRPELGSKAEEFGLPVEYLPMQGSLDFKVIPNVSDIVRRRGISLIHAHGYKSNLFGAFAARWNRIPIVSTNHLYPMMPLNDRKLKMYGQLDVKVTSRFLDRIVAVSEDIQRRMTKQGVPASKVQVIENGIDTSAFSTTSEASLVSGKRALGIDSESLVVGSLARLTPQKGQEYLLDAAAGVLAKRPSVTFVIAGDGPLKEALAEQAERLDISDRVKLLGFRRDTRALLGSMDVFALSSIEEGLPMAMLEAMAARVPVVTTRVGDIPKVIESGRNGLLVNARSSAELTEALLRLLGDPVERSALAERAYDTVVRGFSQEAMCEKYLALYSDLLGRRVA